MTNPDRAELGLQSTPVSENSRKSGHVPSWARVPVLAVRTSLAILAATPGMVVVADTINHRENASIVYDSDKNVTINLQSLIPPSDPQPLAVYKLYMTAGQYVYRDSKSTSNFIDNWGRTHIGLKAGQTLEISATGRVLLQDQYYEDRYVRNCNSSNLIDPDGYRYWRDTVCPPDRQSQGIPWDGAPRGALISNIGNGPGYEPQILIGSHWKGSVDRDGNLYLQTNIGTFYATSGGFDITVTVYPPNPTPTSAPPLRPAFTPEPIRTTVPTGKSSDLPGWLLGAGATFLTVLAANRLYRRQKVGKGTTTVPTTGTVGGTSSGAASVPRIRGIAGVLGAGANPNIAPNFGPAQQKNPEWITGQQEFEKRWQDVKRNLSPLRPGDSGNEPEYILDRFKASMGIVHEVSLGNWIRVPLMAMRVRAGIEYLIPKIWPDNRILKRFFDPNFNAGFLTAESLARMIYLPEGYRNLSSFTNDQRRDIQRIHRIFVHALHPDTARADSDKNLQGSVDDLLKTFNPAWSYVESLIK